VPPFSTRSHVIGTTLPEDARVCFPGPDCSCERRDRETQAPIEWSNHLLASGLHRTPMQTGAVQSGESRAGAFFSTPRGTYRLTESSGRLAVLPSSRDTRHRALEKRITITTDHTKPGLSAPDDRLATCSSPHVADEWNEIRILSWGPMAYHGILMTRPQLLRRLGAGAASGSPLRVSWP
jgi:hypothetical protein